MKKFILLKQNILLQAITEKQYQKLVETREKVGNKVDITVPLHNEARGIVIKYFKKDELSQIGEREALGLVKYNKCVPRSINNEMVTRFRYHDFRTNQYHTKTDHADQNHYSAMWSLDTAIKSIESSDYYLIARHAD